MKTLKRAALTGLLIIAAGPLMDGLPRWMTRRQMGPAMQARAGSAGLSSKGSPRLSSARLSAFDPPPPRPSARTALPGGESTNLRIGEYTFDLGGRPWETAQGETAQGETAPATSALLYQRFYPCHNWSGSERRPAAGPRPDSRRPGSAPVFADARSGS